MGKYLGKINLAEEAPDHPFVNGAILFIPKPPTVSNGVLQGTKPVEDVKKLPPEEDAKRPLGER